MTSAIDPALQSLQAALAGKQGGGPFALDAAFLGASLGSASVIVPAAYDADVVAAFQVPTAAGFSITLPTGSVGPVDDDGFTVEGASITFFAKTYPASLAFAVDAKTPAELVVQIETCPQSWTWTDSFEFADQWPFTELTPSDVSFVFSTEDGSYPWWDSKGPAVEGGPKQNIAATAPVPAAAAAARALFDQGSWATSVELRGALDLSKYDGSQVLYPSGTVSGLLQSGKFEIAGYLRVADPSVVLTLPEPPLDGDTQAPSLAVSVGLGVATTAPGSSPYQLLVDLAPPAPDGSTALVPANGGGSPFNVRLQATGKGSLLSPAAIIELAAGKGSYFSSTPAVLQRFLADVGLLGLVLSGELDPFAVGSITVLIGSAPDTQWRPLPAVSSDLDFVIEGFQLQWSILNPFDGDTRQQSFVFRAQFTLAPAIFKGPQGVGDGIFEVEFTSGLQFYASFDGTAKLSDFVTTLTGLALPPGVEAELSDIRLALDYNAKSFTFASGFSITLDFLEIGGKPVLSISDGEVMVSAVTPTQPKGGGPTGAVWSSEISGLMAVGPLAANVRVAYDGGGHAAGWKLDAALAHPIDVQHVIEQFLDPGGSYDFPDFLPGTLTIKTFSIAAVLPSAGASKYTVATSFSWLFDLAGYQVGIDPAALTIAYDGSQPSGQQLSGSAEGTWVLPPIKLRLKMGYAFKPSSAGANHVLYVEWEGFRAQYTSQDETLAFTAKGWTLGSLIQALVKTLGDPYFTLPSPWDLLNKISLDGLEIDVTFNPVRLSAKYTLSSPLDLGFLTIEELIFGRDTSGKVTLAIKGSVPDALKPALGDLMDPDKGQDVQKMPDVPGRGSSYFKVCLLVLGQRIGITGHESFDSTADVIAALASVPSTTGDESPVKPAPDPTPGQPYYDQSAGWLVAGHLKLLQVEGTWTVDVMVVFNDPDLYGLRLTLAGAKAGGLAGLCVDVLYKKITDDIGLYQVLFTFPDSIRKLDFGAVSVTLPTIGIQIYTNGDFLIDIGFPYKMDFSRSFSFSAIVYGVPVMGSGGFYFGKLSSATATQVPVTTKGTFDPVIVFGVGLQIGLGYDFTKGPLSAGFSITFFGIVEGVIAPWHPYVPSALPATGSMQDDYYFKLDGTIGIIGLLYGKIDFAIIQASLNVKIVLSIQMTYESYRAIPLVATASVDVSLEVKINLGLFSISISLSYSTSVTATFRLGSDETAPWDDGAAIRGFVARRSALLSAGPAAARALAAAVTPRPKRIVAADGAGKAQLTAVISPMSTVLAPEGATDYSLQEGAFVLLLAMDAPDPSSTSVSSADTSFDQLCASFFPWLVDAFAVREGDMVDFADAAGTVVTRQELESYVERLANLDDPAFTIEELLGFMKDGVELNLVTPGNASSATQAAVAAGATLFPVFDGLSLTVPDAGGSGTRPIDFETYATATSGYRTTVAGTFAEVEATIAKASAPPEEEAAATRTLMGDDDESMAALVFVDTFSIIGRQLLQCALDALHSYAYPLGDDDSIQTIITWAGTTNALHSDDVALPNQDHALSPSIALTVPPSTSVVQANDTLTTIARRYSDSAGQPRWTSAEAALIVSNADSRVIDPGVTVTLTGTSGPVPYETLPGDSFGAIADTLGISVQGLAQQTALYGLTGLLTPAQTVTIPEIAYTTAPVPAGKTVSPDSLASVAQSFGTSVSALAAANVTVQKLFSTVAEGGHLTLANLTQLSVGDLWTSIAATGEVAQTAGMVSRFLMFGLRLPAAAGLTLSGEFLYPMDQQGYGLYQLTGQQFPTPATGDAYELTIARAASSHGVDLGFVTFDGAAVDSADVPVQGAFEVLSALVAWAKTGAFQPAPAFQALPASSETPKAFAAQSSSLWTTSDVAGLVTLTDRGGPAPAPAADPQPALWMLPPALTELVSTREKSITAAVGDMAKTIPLLPQAMPQAGRTSPATRRTSYRDLDRWAWTTRVDFGVKRLPAVAPPGADTTPSGPASAPSLPNVYEVVGASSAQTLLLEQLLVAMDALGEDIVSDTFLLYERDGSLTTLAADQFLAFVTQTNLSTETNPEHSTTLARMLGLSAPTGIGNSPGELVKLLWELSVVRSGGYYLYYSVAESREGLPASIFDASGSGTMSLVVTYATTGTNSFGTSVPSFVNSFVTTDSIDSRDVVRLESRRGSGSSAALTGSAGETLATVSATYGATPGRIASANSTIALRSGSTIPFSGLVHQLSPADVVDPSKALDVVASHYSAGAASRITADAISRFNPNVAVALGSIFFIPPFEYVIPQPPAPASGPGATFGSMATYYGTSVEAVAVAALDVGGLFDQGTVLIIDTQLFDVQANVGPANVAFELSLPAATEADDPATEMARLYRSLSAGLCATPFFSKSPLGLPFGPLAGTNGAGTDDAFAGHATRAELRAARLRAAAAADDTYSQTLGFGSFTSLNAAPDLPGLPPPASSPYVGVGAYASIALRWQDAFGNTTVTPFEAPPRGYAGAIDGAAAPVLYGDLLVGVAAWPNVRSSYVYAGTSDAPVLTLDLALDGTAFQGQPDEAKRALAVFQTVYFQLHQDYTGLGLPGVTGNAVSMSVTTSLLADPERPLADSEADVVRGFVADCVKYLSALVGGSQVPSIPAASLALPLSGALAGGTVFELGVTLVFRRLAQLVDPKVAALAGGLETASEVLAQADTTTGAVSYKVFADAFESVFTSTDWYMKVGEGLPNPQDPNGGHELWAVRFGNSEGNGIHFVVGDSPSYYAPKPIASALANDSADIVDYGTGSTATINFRGVDQNLWFESVLQAIDSFLSAGDSTSAFILDKCLGTDDPQTDGYLGKVLLAKQSLADSIGSAVEPILSTSKADESTSWAAGEAMRQRLLDRLAAAYTAGAVVVFDLDGVSGGGTTGAAGPPNLYAHPDAQASSGADNQNFTLSAGRIPLGPTTVNDQGTTQTYDPRLAFTFVSKNVQEAAYVPLQRPPGPSAIADAAPGLKISHLEFGRELVAGIEGYVQSQWLAFVNAPAELDLGSQPLDVPVVNRALPAPPSVQGQSGTKPDVQPQTVADLTKWDYGFLYAYGLAAGDSVNVELRLNPDDSALQNEAVPEEKKLFDALAQFVSSYPAIVRDFAAYLPKIGRGEVDQATLDGAKKAMSSFQQYVTAVADAYAASLRPSLSDAAVGEPEQVVVTFEIALDQDDSGDARTDILSLEIDGSDATWDQTAQTISATIENKTIVLPAPVVSISGYTPEAVTPPDNVAISYRYATGDAPVTYLSYDDARRIPSRGVTLEGLDVLAYQGATAAIWVVRNRLLFPVEDAATVSTCDTFLFQTPVVRFADKVTPRLEYQAFALDDHWPGGASALQTILDGFFADLFTGGDGSTSVKVSMTSAYSYEIVEGQSGYPRVSLPVAMLPPADALVDPTVAPAFTGAVASTIDSWKTANDPTLDGAPALDFELQVFGTSGTKQPLLVVDDLSCDVEPASAR